MVVPFALVRLQQDTLDALRAPTLPFALDRLQQDTLDAMRDPMLERV